VRAAEIRRLAAEETLERLEHAAEGIAEREEDPDWVTGTDLGEKLTHLLLAARIRRRVSAGEDAKEAFRAELASVRDLLANT